MKKLLLLILSLYAVDSIGQGATTCANATTITTNGNYTIGALTTGTAPTGAGLCFTTYSTTPNARWFKFTPTTNGVMTINSDIAGNPANADTRLSVLTGACAAPWTCIAANDDVDESAQNFRSKVTDVVVTSGTTYYIVWDDRWSSTSATFDFSFTGQSCFVPTGFTFTSAPTTTTAGIGWTAPTNGTPVGYEFEYGVRGFAQGQGQSTIISNTALQTSVSLTDLQPSTVYEFYIRTNCGNGDYSLWQGPISFNTDFLPSNVPYNTSFEDEFFDYIGWFAPAPATGEGQVWTINAAGSGNATVQDQATSVFSFAGTTAISNVNMISRGLNLQGNEEVTVTLWARNFLNPTTLTNTSTIQLYYGNEQTIAAQTNLIGTQAGIAAETFTQYTFTFTPPTTGVYYISVRNVSPALPSASGVYAVILDNFSVTQTLSNNDFLAANLSVYPNPASSVVNISNTLNAVVNTVEIADLNGRVVKTLNVNNTEAQISISDLAAGVYMLKVSTDQGTATKKIVKQ
jgi:hypothetical protein